MLGRISENVDRLDSRYETEELVNLLSPKKIRQSLVNDKVSAHIVDIHCSLHLIRAPISTLKHCLFRYGWNFGSIGLCKRRLELVGGQLSPRIASLQTP
jgi:hypothetical protein